MADPLRPEPDDRSRTRQRLLAVAAAVVGLTIVVVVVLLIRQDDARPAVTVTDPPAPPSLPAGQSPTPTASADGSPRSPQTDGDTGTVTPPAGEDGAPTAPGATLAPVPLTQTARFGDGVTAQVVSTQAVRAEANGPGEVDGPAVAFTIALVNGTGEPIPLTGAVVNAYHGADETPAAPVTSDRRNDVFDGDLGAGSTAQGTYVFSLPRRDRDAVRLEVSHAALSPVAVFQGPVS